MSLLELVQDAGCSFDSDRIVLATEPALLRRELSRRIRSDARFPNNLDDLVESLTEYLQDVDCLRKCLLPCTLSGSDGSKRNQDSLIRIILSVDAIQPHIITYILERLPEFYDELENDQSSSCTARLILHQLRWSEHIVEPHKLSEKLIEIIEITPTVIQHELITSLPDIVTDAMHKSIATYLKELMNEKSELTVPVLDTLSNLTLHPDSLDELRETVLERLESAELDDLAIIVKFLLQTSTSHSIDFVILGIRNKLDFRSLGTAPIHASNSSSSSQLSRKNTPEALILESIKTGLQFHKFVCDAWIKSLVALTEPEAHRVIDVVVLFILHSMTSMKKKIEQIFRKKVAAGLIGPALIDETVQFHAIGLANYWGTLLSLAENVLRGSQQQTTLATVANALYAAVFKASDAYYRQEVVGALVTHVGSGQTMEMDTALGCLLSLSRHNVNAMVIYGVFIKGVLDYLDNLSLSQIRTLFTVYSILALAPSARMTSGTAANLWSDIQIIIRKQLANPRVKYKKIGVVGSLAAVSILSSQELHKQDSASETIGQGSSSQAPMRTYSEPLLREARQMIELIMRHCQEQPICVTLMYDELTHMMMHCDMVAPFQTWLSETLTGEFGDQYVVAMEEAETVIGNISQVASVTLKPQVKYHLDGQDGSIVLRLYDMVYNVGDKKKQKRVAPFCAIFGLLQASQKRLCGGSLEEIDGLLGCGIVLFQTQDIEDVIRDLQTHEITDACDILFYAINWMRELLNAFCDTDTQDEETVSKCIARLKNTIEMEALLEKLSSELSSPYVPLELHHTSSVISYKGKGLELKSTGASQSSANAEAKKPKPAPPKAVKESINYKHHLRALKLEVLTLLQRREIDGDRLGYPEISYILTDLNEKLDIKIVPAPFNSSLAKKKANIESKHNVHTLAFLSRMSSAEFVANIITYLPYIVEFLENLYEDVQLQDTQSGRIPKEAEPLVKCTSQIFNILYKLLSWPGFQNVEHHDLLRRFVRVLAQRISCDVTQTRDFHLDVADAHKYLARFRQNMPQASTIVMLYKILDRLMAMSTQPISLKATAYSTVTYILSTEWLDWRDIKKDMPFLVEQSVEMAEEPLDALQHYVGDVLPRYEQEDTVEGHPLLRSDNVPFYYQALINQMVKAIDTVLEQAEEQDPADTLMRHGRVVKMFERITTYIKTKNQRNLYTVLLKHARAFVDQFIKHTIPYFSRQFRNHRDTIMVIFKDFQTSTRMLQIICSHVKVLKDIQLAAHVPPLKKSMESVIFQVKMLLTENNAPADAFFLGALKHRDIRGMEVSSQIPRDESDIDDDEDEEDEEEDERENIQGEEEDTESVQVSRSVKARKVPKSKPATKAARRGEQPIYRTSSQVPTSDEEEEEDEEQLILESEDEHEESSRRTRTPTPAPNSDEDDDQIVDEAEENQVRSYASDEDEQLAEQADGGGFVVESAEEADETEEAEESEDNIENARPVSLTSKQSEAVAQPRKRRLGPGRPRIPKKMKF